MEIIQHYVIQFNTALTRYLESFDINPKLYFFMFPPQVDRSKINDMVKEGIFPTLSGLAPAITFFLFLSICRIFVQSIIIKPLAIRAMTLTPTEQMPDTLIEKEFPKYKKTIKEEDIVKFIAHSKKPEREIRSYLRIRTNNKVIERKLTKYIEAAWRFFFFTFFSVVGYFCVLYPEPSIWITDYSEMWIGYPYHKFTDKMKIYYIVELGSYLHQLCWTEIARSDSWQMLFHHLITLALILLSYVTNFTRIGTAIMIIHDIADVFLELAKVMNYTSQGKGHRWLKPPTDVVFGIFAVVFFLTRLVFYPYHILYSLVLIAVPLFTFGFAGAYIWLFLLISLQLLHVFWFFLIMRMVYRLLTTGVEKDERSDDDDEIIDEAEEDVKIAYKKKN